MSCLHQTNRFGFYTRLQSIPISNIKGHLAARLVETLMIDSSGGALLAPWGRCPFAVRRRRFAGRTDSLIPAHTGLQWPVSVLKRCWALPERLFYRNLRMF